MTEETSESTTTLYVWDYAGEDGDYVQVLVNGDPVTEEFMIKHQPREITVPTSGTVQIKGIHDAGGGPHLCGSLRPKRSNVFQQCA